MEKRLSLFEEKLFTLKEGSVEHTFIPKHPKLKRRIFGLVYSLAKKNSFEEMELLGSAASFAWEALASFKLEDSANWDDIISGIDQHNLNRIVRAICKKIEHELPALANPNTKRMYDPETQGKMFVTIEFDSLDKPIYDENDEIKGFVIEDAVESFFALKGETLKNPFVEWFRANRHNFLTRRQNDFIDAMTEVTLHKDTDYVDEDDFVELIGMKPHDLDRIKKRISTRTLAAWDEFTSGKPEFTRRGTSLLRKVDELGEFLKIAESDTGLNSQNKALSEWIRDKETSNGEDVVDFLYDSLTSDVPATLDFATFLKGESENIRPVTLYKINRIIETEVARLRVELAGLPPSKVVWQPNYERRAQNAESARKYREFIKENPCHVYDSGGRLIRTMKSDIKEYKIVELNAFGVTNNLREGL